MRARWSWPLALHTALWIALSAIFLCVSVPRTVPQILRNSIGPIDAFHSFDLYLFGVTDVPDASQRVVRMFSLLPRHRPVLIFTRSDELASSFLGMAMAYLAWPREVQLVCCSQSEIEKRLADIQPGSISAVIFCKVKQPAWFPSGVYCGPNIEVVCLTNSVARR